MDVLLAEHEASTPPQARDEAMARKLAVTWGLYCQVHRFARRCRAELQRCQTAAESTGAPIGYARNHVLSTPCVRGTTELIVDALSMHADGIRMAAGPSCLPTGRAFDLGHAYLND